LMVVDASSNFLYCTLRLDQGFQPLSKGPISSFTTFWIPNEFFDEFEGKYCFKLEVSTIERRRCQDDPRLLCTQDNQFVSTTALHPTNTSPHCASIARQEILISRTQRRINQWHNPMRVVRVAVSRLQRHRARAQSRTASSSQIECGRAKLSFTSDSQSLTA
jgi:hypothetical protein